MVTIPVRPMPPAEVDRDLFAQLFGLLDTWLAVITFLAAVAIVMTIVCWRMGLIDAPKPRIPFRLWLWIHVLVPSRRHGRHTAAYRRRCGL